MYYAKCTMQNVQYKVYYDFGSSSSNYFTKETPQVFFSIEFTPSLFSPAPSYYH
jgi:hypothetical protein